MKEVHELGQLFPQLPNKVTNNIQKQKQIDVRSVEIVENVESNVESSLLINHIVIYNLAYMLAGAMSAFLMINPLTNIQKGDSLNAALQTIFFFFFVTLGFVIAFASVLIFQHKISPKIMNQIIGWSVFISGFTSLLYVFSNQLGIWTIHLLSFNFGVFITLISIFCRFLIMEISLIPRDLGFISINMQILNAMFYLGCLIGFIIADFDITAILIAILLFYGGFILFNEKKQLQGVQNQQNQLLPRLLQNYQTTYQNGPQSERQNPQRQNFPKQLIVWTYALTILFGFFDTAIVYLPFIDKGKQTIQMSQQTKILMYAFFCFATVLRFLIAFMIKKSAQKLLKFQAVILILFSIVCLLFQLIDVNKIQIIVFLIMAELVTINYYPLIHVITVKNHNSENTMVTNFKMDLKTIANMTLNSVSFAIIIWPIFGIVIVSVYGSIGLFISTSLISVVLLSILLFYKKVIPQNRNQ